MTPDKYFRVYSRAWTGMTGFLRPRNFRHLATCCRLPVDDAYGGYAGFCYLRLVADAWRTCERRAVTTAVRGITSETVQARRSPVYSKTVSWPKVPLTSGWFSYEAP